MAYISVDFCVISVHVSLSPHYNCPLFQPCHLVFAATFRGEIYLHLCAAALPVGGEVEVSDDGEGGEVIYYINEISNSESNPYGLYYEE